ncbi:MAG: response regulator [Deltaproteobacteria bacterium]|nr:response regulator [Deltaproteobacteria bacterium]
MQHILIADDSRTARLFIKKCLEIIGLEEVSVTEAVNGAEALDLIKKGAFDLLITDLNMPEMDGQDLLRRIKASPKTTDLPVLVITSVGNPAKEKELLSLGALAVLTKPVTPADMLDTLEDLINE